MNPLALLVACVAGWMNRHQQVVVDYLQEEVRILHRHADGKVRLESSAPPEQACLIEASTNLVDWEKIGVAVECGPGEFEFEDLDAAGAPVRFYRLVATPHGVT